MLRIVSKIKMELSAKVLFGGTNFNKGLANI